MSATVPPAVISVAGAAFVKPAQNGDGMRFYGSTSGYAGLKPGATITSYDLALPLNVGTVGQVLTTDGVGVMTWTTPSVTTPAGTGTELQYRLDANTFGAVAGTSWNGTYLAVPKVRLLAGSAAAPSLVFPEDLDTGVYNTGIYSGFNGMINFSVAGALRVRVNTTGLVLLVNNATQPAISSFSGADGFFWPAGANVGVTIGGVETTRWTANTVLFSQASADASSFDLNFRKARGTVASPTLITTGDVLGTFTGYGYSGAGGYVAGAQIRFESTGTIASGVVPGKIVMATASAAGAMTDLFTIQVGEAVVSAVLRSAPYQTRILEIQSTGANGTISFAENLTIRGYIGYGDAGAIFTNSATDSLNLRAEGFLHLGSGDNTSITCNGLLVGINKSSSIGAQLHVVSSSATTIGQIITGATNHSVPLLQLNMTGTPTGNVFEINRPGLSGGDPLGIDVFGTLTMNSDGTDQTRGFKIIRSASNPTAYSLLTHSGGVAVIECRGGPTSWGTFNVTITDGTTNRYPLYVTEMGVGIGGTSIGTNGISVLTHSSGTAPSTSPADCYQLYSADQAAGNACPHIRTENAAIIKLFQGAAVADAAGGVVIDAEARTALNALLARDRANGLIAT